MSQCRLCKKQVKLEESHIIPKFIGKWLRKTSATGYLRSIDNPNIRRRDLFKVKLLCKSCEDLFSDTESYFAETIFHPYVNRENFSYNLSYNHNLSKFFASLSWRVLVYLTEFLNNETSPEIEKCKSKLEDFLLGIGNTSNLDQYEQHLIPLESGSQSLLNTKHSNINSYFCRAIDTDLLNSKSGSLIYIKIPNFMIISNINYKYINKMRSSRVALKHGVLAPKEYILPIEMQHYLDNRLTFIKENITNVISETQNDKILSTIKNDLDRFENSHTLKIVEADLYPNQFIFRDKGKPL